MTFLEALQQEAPDMYDNQAFIKMIHAEAIDQVFQPIVDIFFGEVVGYEVLSRGMPPWQKPSDMFARAEDWGLLWDLEEACHAAAIRAMGRVQPPYRNKKFFINVSPIVFCNPKFVPEKLLGALEAARIDQSQLVLEITEVNRITDYPLFEQLIRQQVDSGFEIAIDDFGTGHSGLITLLAASPHFIKLDRALISNIHESAYKQHLITAILSFVRNVDGKLVAEGVEKMEELETLFRLGIRYAQGFFLGRPAGHPQPILPEAQQEMQRLSRRFHYPRISFQTPVSSLALRPPSFNADTTTCMELDLFFRRHPSVDHIIAMQGDQIFGIIPKQHFHTITGGPYGYNLVQRKPIHTIAKRSVLQVRDGIDLSLLGRLAMEREQEDLYDPVIVMSPDESFTGTITMRQLLIHSSRMEVQVATSANPLTSLPGNVLIEAWLQSALSSGSFTVIYADLDRFKEFNDTYGFPQGDQMIKLTARLLSDHLPGLAKDANLGHLGGDDFVVVAESALEEVALQELCDAFDQEKLRLFRTEDINRGYYCVENRLGKSEQVPLVTLSFAVITEHNLGAIPHAGHLGQIAASLKKRSKMLNARNRRSGFLIDRRRYDDAAGVPV